MLSFNHKKMRDAAWNRFERRIRRRGDEEEARRTWVREALAIDAIATVANWLNSRGISLKFKKRTGAAFYFDSKTVVASSTLRPDAALVYILHECGHVLIGNEGASDRYAMGYPKQHDPKHNRSFQHRMAVLDEEMEAWHRGKKLAKRLKIGWCISERLWEEKKLDCLKTYVHWALHPREFKD